MKTYEMLKKSEGELNDEYIRDHDNKNPNRFFVVFEKKKAQPHSYICVQEKTL